MKQNQRDSNFELLRIFCIIFIIAHHLSLHSQQPVVMPPYNEYLFRGLTILGKAACNIFVLISGYFMINSNFKFRKLLKLIFQVLFYSITIYLIFCLTGLESFNFKTFVKQIFPIYNYQYWFISCFVVLYALSPFLNKLLKQCTLRETLLLLAVLLIIQIRIFGTDIHPSFPFNKLVWLTTMYITGAFIKLHYENKDKKLYAWLILLSSFIGMLVGFVFFKKVFWTDSDLPCYAFSVSLFYLFRYVKIKPSKVINTIASTSLGIYLIHDNKFIRPYLWKVWLNTSYHLTLNTYWLFAVTAILLVFTTCFVIDFLRILLDKLFTKIIKRKKA